MLKHFVEFQYPGSFFPETEVKEVANRNEEELEIPKRAFGYFFYDQEIIETETDRLVGKRQNISPRTLIGEIKTLDQIRALEPKSTYSILVSNMECNGWNSVCLCRTGNYQPIQGGERVITLKP